MLEDCYCLFLFLSATVSLSWYVPWTVAESPPHRTKQASVTTDMTSIKSVTAWKEVACIYRANVCSMRYPTGWEEGYRLSLPGLTSCWIICLGNTQRKQIVAVLSLLHVHTSSAWADKLNSNWKMLSVTKCSLPSLSFTLTCDLMTFHRTDLTWGY